MTRKISELMTLWIRILRQPLRTDSIHQLGQSDGLITLVLIPSNQALFELGHSTSRGHPRMSIARGVVKAFAEIMFGFIQLKFYQN